MDNSIGKITLKTEGRIVDRSSLIYKRVISLENIDLYNINLLNDIFSCFGVLEENKILFLKELTSKIPSKDIINCNIGIRIVLLYGLGLKELWPTNTLGRVEKGSNFILIVYYPKEKGLDFTFIEFNNRNDFKLFINYLNHWFEYLCLECWINHLYEWQKT